MTEAPPTTPEQTDRRLALFEAAECGGIDELLTHYDDGEQDVRRLGQPLLLAALGNADEVARTRITHFLLDQGAEPVANAKGFGPLHVAFARGWSDPSALTRVVRRLLDVGADRDGRTYDFRAPSHLLALLRLPEESLTELYDLWFGGEPVDLTTPNAHGADPVVLVRRLGSRPVLLRRMQEHRAAHADRQEELRAAAGEVPTFRSHVGTGQVCLATHHVVEGAAPVAWMIREEPAWEGDSGWRFWSEEDVPRYRDDTRQVVVVPVDEAAAVDPYVVGAWGLPVGTRLLARRGQQGRQVLDPGTMRPSAAYPSQPQETR
ncbi:immunity protein Imm33 domain-containing protein [Georgenia sp. Z1491]|uniref:immunity protein Imm33 domain-containing protein n=1 Tax=Georgenia sp. Z1491 TaxID=3416707 RepID=UPI003CFA7526